MRAEVLRHLHTKENRNISSLQQLNQEAFDYYGYGELLNKYPQLALDGIRKLGKTCLKPFVVAKRTAVALARIHMNEIAQNPTKSLFSFFTNPDLEANAHLNKFLNDMHNVTSISDIYGLLNQLPNVSRVDTFKETLLQELKKEQLIPEVSRAAPSK